MSFFEWIKSRLAGPQKSRDPYARGRPMSTHFKIGMFSNRTFSKRRDFVSEYDASNRLMKNTIDGIFPDNYSARSRPGFNPDYDYSGKRSEAIDRSSAAIAVALRKGASISEAVKLGSKSIGL